MRKIVVIALSAICFCLCLTSCYPELSVQQYDKLKEDLAELNEQTATLEADLAAVTEELEAVKAANAEIKTRNAEIRSYVDFMVQLIATQNTEGLLEGEFDVSALVEAKDDLMVTADTLDDTNVSYYLSLVDPANEAGSVGAYYKVMEYCIKNIKQKLGVNGSNAN